MLKWDFYLFSLINGLSGNSRILDSFMVLMAKWGPVLYGVLLIGMFFIGQDLKAKLKNRQVVVKAVLAALVALAINQLIGLAYFRPRPFAAHKVNLLIDRSPDPSFPSDHATGSGSLTFSVLSGNRLIGSIMFIFMVLLIFSRVYVGTHYPLDVLGGVFTGLLGSSITNRIWPLCEEWIVKLLELYETSSLKVYNKYVKSGQK